MIQRKTSRWDARPAVLDAEQLALVSELLLYGVGVAFRIFGNEDELVYSGISKGVCVNKGAVLFHIDHFAVEC